MPAETQIATCEINGRCYRLLAAGRDYRMTGGAFGDHSITDSSRERAMAHWSGYWQQNEIVHGRNEYRAAAAYVARKGKTMTKTIEAVENALTFLEALGYKGGDVHDDLAAALERLRKAGAPSGSRHHTFEFTALNPDTCCVCGKARAWSAHR